MKIWTDPALLSLGAFAVVAAACGALLLTARQLFRGRGALDEAQQHLRRLPAFSELESRGLIGRLDAWIDRTLYWSGWDLSAAEATLLAFLSVLTGGGAVYVATENELFAAVAGLLALGGLLVPLDMRRRQRMKRFEQQFPAALDLLARAVRAGESIEQAMAVVGEAMGDPVGTEFDRCARQMGLGLSLSACMRSLTRRADQMDVRILGTTLTVHREAGGNLPVTLERLSEVIRDRIAYHRQLKSVTAAGRFSALMIAAVGPLLFGYMFFVQPEYGGKLLADSTGRLLLAAAVVSEVIGTVWILRLIKNDY